jgi:regulator of chromosome condensation
VPALIPDISNVAKMSGGSSHVLALTQDGAVFAWGSGEQNELGRRLLTRRSGRHDTLTPHRVAFPSRAVIRDIFAGSHHSFAIDTRNRVWAFGLNNFGQCGIATNETTGFTTVISPTEVKALQQFKIRHIAGGLHHSVACTEDGTVLVWGRCDDGQMGLPLDPLPDNHVIYDSRERPRVLNMPTVVPGEFQPLRHAKKK